MSTFFEACRFEVEDVIFELESRDKVGVIRELLQRLFEVHALDEADFEELLAGFKRREQQGSTGMQNGIALPHLRVDLVDNFFLALGVHRRGVNFDALDGQLTQVILLTLVPETQANLHLKFLSGVSRLMRQPNFKADLLQAADASAIHQLLLAAFP